MTGKLLLLMTAVAAWSPAGGQTAGKAGTATAAEGYYRSPVDIPVLLSANFAEMRANHFHSGIDIKTQGVEGKKLFAAADGYVSRAGIAPGGYGFSLYIDHPNGTTTVYAHMQSFRDDLKKYVDDWRYANRKHSGDVYFKQSQFPVRKGDFIGLSGNSGMSGGPHLHYEVRESATQMPVNVIARGYLTVRDNIPPQITKLYFVETDTIAGVPVSGRPEPVAIKESAAGKYSLSAAGAVEIPNNCYFLVEVTDRKNDVGNTFGVYGIREVVDGETVFETELDKFAFADTRYKNAVAYYPLQGNNPREVFRLTRMQGNRLRVYGALRNNGVVNSGPGQERDIRIEVTDDAGNLSVLAFKTKGRNLLTARTRAGYDPDAPIARYDTDFNHSEEGARVEIPAGALYESIFWRQSVEGKDSQPYAAANGKRKLYSPIYTIADDDIPLHKSMRIAIETDAPEQLRGKLCLGVVNGRTGALSSGGGTWENGAVAANVRSFGKYCVVADTEPPRITPSFTDGASLAAARQISFTITDDFSGVWDFSGTIDGKWMLFEWDIPKKKIVHNFDPSRFDYTGKTHEIKVVVTDAKGNEKVWEGSFLK